MKSESQLHPGPNLNASNTYVGNKSSYKNTFHLQGYDLIVMEMWWNGCCGMEGHGRSLMEGMGGSLRRTDRRQRGTALHVSDQLECRELRPGMDEQQLESLWIGIKGIAGTGGIIVGVWGRPPNRMLR